MILNSIYQKLRENKWFHAFPKGQSKVKQLYRGKEEIHMEIKS